MCTRLYTQTVKANVRNILSVYFNWEIGIGCRYYESYIFEDFVDKHSQVAGDSMTHSCSYYSKKVLQCSENVHPGHLKFKKSTLKTAYDGVSTFFNFKY